MSELETRDFNEGSNDHSSLDSVLNETPSQIGPYKILRKLGEGGFGIVYQAQQEKPVKRRVALKVIKPGMDSKKVITRFEAERQALALMTHPNIAKVLDGGITERGLPYFVMEMVQGMPITDFCDHNKLSIDERLKLLIPVCQAVQHAHAKSVLHRDLKPSNILVAKDSEGHPHATVIDFGVAKALNDQLSDHSLHTAEGQMVGTPEYMSPEQAGNSGLDIDTRTDVYSLGVVLYELLTGLLPFDSSELRTKIYTDMQRYIREQTPPKPSTRFLSALNQSDQRPSAIASATNRNLANTELPNHLKGELDWVVMKCLEKDRDRRYATPIALAEEIEHYLNNEPIAARPPSASYRFSKLVKRNKAPVAAILLFAAILIAATTISVRYSIIAEQQRETAVEALVVRDDALKAEQLAKQRAEQRAIEAENERAVAQSINDFLNNRLLGAVTPEREGRNVLVRDMLITAAQQLDENPPAIPRVEAALRRTIGHAFRSLGHYQESERHLRRSLQLWQQLPDTTPLHIANIREDLAFTLMHTSQYDEAYDHALRVLDLRKINLGDQDPLTIRTLADVSMFDALRNGEIVARFDNMTLDMLRITRKKGESREEIRQVVNQIVLDTEAFVATGQTEQALQLLRETAQPYLNSPMIRDRVPYAVGSYSIMLSQNGTLRSAEAMALYAIESGKQYLKPDHPYTLHAMYALYTTLYKQSRFEEALNAVQQCLEGRRRAQGDNHEETIHAISLVAQMHHQLGHSEEAIPYYVEAIAQSRKVHGDLAYNTLFMLGEYAAALKDLKRYDESEQHYKESIAGFALSDDDPHNNHLILMINLCWMYIDLSKFTDAETLALESYENCKLNYPNNDGHTALTLQLLVDLYTDWHQANPSANHDTKAAEFQAILDSL
jgi:eukaryotic-like serine/threonine-protein kinase